MAHHKLTTVVGRSFLTATAAAMIVGPLAAAGAAQTLEGVTDTLKLTCEEAFEAEAGTDETKLVEEFCTDAELAELTSPLDKSVDDVTTTVDKTVGDTTAGAPSPTAPGGEEPAPSGPVDPEAVPGGGGGEPAPNPGPKTDVGSTGNDFTGVDEGTPTGMEKGRVRPGATTSTPVESAGYGFNADGPFRPGMRSNSSLTLQPFAAPLVSVPPIYELPQIAQQLFGGDSAAEVPAATAAAPYSATGYTATSADPTGWLAATATGLIMLVGAGHAINGGRTPKQHRA